MEPITQESKGHPKIHQDIFRDPKGGYHSVRIEKRKEKLETQIDIKGTRKENHYIVNCWWSLKLKGTWVLLPWSSSCCSKGTRLCSHNNQEAHTGTSCSTSDRKTCRACGIGSCYISSSIAMGILVISHSTLNKPWKVGQTSIIIDTIDQWSFLFTHHSQSTKQLLRKQFWLTVKVKLTEEKWVTKISWQVV